MASVFVISWNGRGPTGCQVNRFDARIAAEAFTFESLPGDYTAHVVETLADLSNRVIFNGPTLVTIYNALAKADLKRFESLEYGRERVLRTLNESFGDLPVTEVKQKEIQTVAKAAKATTNGTRGRARAYPDDAKIVLRTSENPKREGTSAHERFSLYRNGMRVSTFLEKGGTSMDLNYDVKKEFIEIQLPA